jgi:hypothetical protein
MRHEQADKLYNGPWDEPLESWTSFPLDGPLKLPVPTWIADQLRQPTYMQMSGSVCRFESYLRIRDARPRKKGPMRIEMATVATPCNEFVSEFATPVSIIYGRPNSDRVNYGATARKEDIHLLLHLGRRLLLRPKSALPTTIILSEAVVASKLGSPDATARHDEAWVSRGTVGP